MASTPTAATARHYRLGIAMRALAAIFGGYGVSALAATALALVLPTARVEAAVAATLVALVVYPGAVLWVFAARTAARAWLGLLWLALPLAAVWIGSRV